MVLFIVSYAIPLTLDEEVVLRHLNMNLVDFHDLHFAAHRWGTIVMQQAVINHTVLGKMHNWMKH
jgi:hypothetical protein